ncbi:MAG: hypothetical protein DRP62_00230 [Planctomycetota bacterium]|nr:MAG: hypothetical protein DRP62_00230 [Planctomycetota bacterium]
MRKFVLFMVLFAAVPAMAVSNVDITCTVDGNEVTVSYATDANLIRAFGLDITVDTANIVDLVMVDPNYRIYPGQIVIEDGNVTDYNTPYVPGDLGDADLTVEMGSLYTMDANYAGDPNLGYGMQPGTSGVLFKFYVDGDCNYVVTENELRGGVVMEDPEEDPNVTLCSGNITIVTDCMAATNPGYANWLYWGKPDCWCYKRQCRGDVDGLKQGPFWVSQNDLALFRLSINKLEAQLPPNGECSDFDHQKQGPFWVSQNDLAIFRLYINKLEAQVPCCDSNQDCVPDGVNYNFWTN